MEFLADYGLFLAKTATFVIAVLVVIVTAVGLSHRQKGRKGELEITNISERMEHMLKGLRHQLLDKHQYKVEQKAEKKHKKQEKKAQKAAQKEAAREDSTKPAKPRLFVLDFNGSMDAHETDALREEITAIIAVAEEGDEVLLRLESPGGAAHAYGLAASQLQRLRDKDLTLTVAVDKVAASGGYMMAVVANKVVAAPFAIIGSIGVVAQLPNIHRLLKKHDIDVELHTAGEYKRTLTMLGENDDKARAKFKEQLEEAHQLFKEHVKAHRPALDLSQVATGEHWFASQALEKGLVDELSTSDDYLLGALPDKTIYQVRYHARPKLRDRLSNAVSEGIERAAARLLLRDPASHI